MTITTDAHPTDSNQVSRRRDLPPALNWVLLGVASLLWIASLGHVDLARISDYGLISALPPAFFAAVALSTVSFFIEVGRPERRASVLWAHLIASVVFLQAVVGIVEPMPRFSTAWIHSGFTNLIAETHTTLPLLDARFSWPGFFGLSAFLSQVAGLDTALWFVRWAPVVLGLAILLPAASIIRVAAVSAPAQWTALWLLTVGNWVGQDYFSPQALNFFLYLTLVAVLLRYFRPGDTSIRIPLLHRFHSLETPPDHATPAARAGLAVVVIGLGAASIVSHQLTPFAIVAATAALVVGGRCTLRLLPVLFAVMAVAWLSFAAEAYWIGHLADVTGGIGRLPDAMQSGVGDRLRGSTGHLFVLRLRMLATIALWILAAIGTVRCLRRNNNGVPWPHVVLALTPLGLVGVQSYGGEILLRVYMFGLPFLALLAALAFFPGGGEPGVRPTRGSLLAATAMTLVATVAFLVIRYGNERFEHFSAEEVAAVEWLYENAPPNSRLVALNPQLPWRDRKVDEYSYIGQVDRQHLDDGEEILSYLTPKTGADGYLVVTRSQEAYGEMTAGEEPGWTTEIERLLLATGKAEAVYQNADATVYRHRGSLAVKWTRDVAAAFLGVGLVVLALAVLDFDSPFEHPYAVAYFGFGPGTAVVTRMRIDEPLLAASLSIGISVVITMATFQLMLLTGWFSPVAGLAAVLGLTALVLAFPTPAGAASDLDADSKELIR